MTYFYTISELEEKDLGPGYSSARGGHIRGERIQVADVRKDQGTGSRLHSHPNEQFNFIVKGEMRVKIGEEAEQVVGPGTLLHIPAGTPHYTVAVSEGGAEYYAIKDTTWEMWGEAVDGTKSGPHVDVGFSLNGEEKLLISQEQESE